MKRLVAVCFIIVLLAFLPPEAVAQRNSRKASPEKMADSLNRLGLKYYNNDNEQKAETNYLKAIAVARKYNLKKELGLSLYNLSRLYSDTEDYLTAIALGEESVGILQKAGDKETVVNCLLNLERCYRRHGIIVRAMTYADSAVKTMRTFKNDKLLEVALWRQGQIYRKWNAELAIPIFKEALALAKKIPEYENIDNMLGSLAHCHTDPYTGRYDPKMAEYYHKLALDAALKYDRKDVNTCRIDYGKICTMNEKYEEAEYQLKLVYDEASANKIIDDQSVAAFCLSEVYFGMGDFPTAYRYLTEHQSLEDRFNAGEKKGMAEKMAFNFKTKRIETQNKLLKKERELQRAKLDQESFRKSVKVWVSVITALFLALVTLFLYRFLKKKNLLLSKRSNTLRQQLLLTQMSPHFITSSIDSIQKLIREDKPDVAATYLSKFARLTRQILENSAGDYISLEEEIAMVTNYLTVQQLLHQGGFSFTVDDDGLDAEAVYLPPMLTQPLLANAVKRIAHNPPGERHVAVRFGMKNRKLRFEVGDTGGPLKPGEQRSIFEAQDVRITMERLGTQNSMPVMISNVAFRNGMTGIKAAFEIPYITDD
ncbi:histidine kinase [Flavobacterium sp. MFBS3-15]|uniref:tetratricopeptide repeat-containing sensor histidine kinase n=1 Tax=Flavobacterium sp. MFBS3-15 TaxID=2989816 RepID=UPI002235B7B4|nr:histidine kinase [Flavobacterium sp. MFBS3-15]MCW4468144.1 histidine kinase [Flavobacterium sp. MFBS3-15]